MNDALKAMQERAGPFSAQAFEFVRDGLAFTSRRLHGEPPSTPGVEARVKKVQASPKQAGPKKTPPKQLIVGSMMPTGMSAADGQAQEQRHVSGRQLCEGLRDFALQQYGLLAGHVLAAWGVRATADFGSIVFAMIDGGYLRKSDEDSKDDFEGVYRFEDAFPDVLARAE